MGKQPSTKRSNGRIGQQVSFDYLKSHHFRVIRADGAIGSVTPNGHIHCALYSERPAIPRHTVHEIQSDGKLGNEVTGETVSRGGIVREMEVDVFLTVDVAKSLVQWLEDKISEATNGKQPSPKRRG